MVLPMREATPGKSPRPWPTPCCTDVGSGRIDDLQLNKKHVLYQQVHEVPAGHYVMVVHLGATLLHER
jgi:hypothetical protein